jgi:hypothetical protein
MDSWNPLLNPSYGVPEIKAWRELLLQDTPSDYSDHLYDSRKKIDSSPQGVFLQLANDVLMPKIRSAIW